MDARGNQSPVEFVNLQLQSPAEIQQPPHQSPYQPWNTQAPGLGGIQLEVDANVIKEPRGFIKIVEFFMSIFAFATTCGFSTYLAYKIHCPDAPPDAPPDASYRYDYDYAFRLNTIVIQGCNRTLPLTGDFSSQSQYFVASGVLAFLYSLGALAFYVLKDKLYRSNALIPMLDFWLTVVMAVLWLTASSAWAQGLTDVKKFSDPNLYEVKLCPGGAKCLDSVFSGSFATLNVSVLIGFVNFVLWAANLWFIYKETTWFLNRGMQPGQPGQPGQMPK